jgi:F0F1-type ATP synthase membrane subunit b/b'
METFEQIDRIEKMISEARRVPFTSNIIVNEEEMYDLIDELRQILPEEFKQARWIVKERQEMLEEAKKDAERLVQEAIERAERLVGETEIVKKATRQAEEIIRAAETRARTIRMEAEDYADEKLANIQAILHKLLTTVEKGREQLQGKPAEEEVIPEAYLEES